MPKQGKYPDELRERAVRLVLDHGHEYGSQWEAICSVADKLGPKPETARLWVRQVERATRRAAQSLRPSVPRLSRSICTGRALYPSTSVSITGVYPSSRWWVSSDDTGAASIGTVAGMINRLESPHSHSSPNAFTTASRCAAARTMSGIGLVATTGPKKCRPSLEPIGEADARGPGVRWFGQRRPFDAVGELRRVVHDR